MSGKVVNSKNHGTKANNGDTPELVAPPFWECLKAATSTLECGKAFYFDSRGDLTLKVGGKEVAYEFVVCSRTLSRWSSVFSAMLFGGFAESQPSNAAWSVNLPEDLPSSTFLVLSIVHGHFEHVPTSLSKAQLYQTLVVTEKYDMTKIVRPWASTWFAPYKTISQIGNNEILLWICWELGYTANFRWLAKDLLLSSSVNSNGQLIGLDGVTLSTYTCLEPTGLLEEVTKRRRKIIDAIVQTIYNVIDAAIKGQECRGQPQIRECPKCNARYKISVLECARCRSEVYSYGKASLNEPSWTLSPLLCKALVFGSLAREVSKRLGQDFALMKTPRPHIRSSINSLLLSINSMKIDLPIDHQACNPLPNTQKIIQGIVESATSPVMNLHLEYLMNQAKKTGV